MSELDKDFDKVAEAINEKIEQAAKLLKEANKLGTDAGMEYLGGGYYTLENVSKEQAEMIKEIDFKPVLRALEDAGWSISSLECS